MTRSIILTALVLALTACTEEMTSYEVLITPEAMQSTLEAKLPIEKKGKLGQFSLTQPKLLVDGKSGKLGLELSVEVQLNELKVGKKVVSEAKSVKGRVGLQGVLAYESGAFFLRSPDVTRMEVEGLSEKQNAWLKKAVEKAARAFLETTPVYRLELTDAKQAAAELVLKSTTVGADGNLHVVLGL